MTTTSRVLTKNRTKPSKIQVKRHTGNPAASPTAAAPVPEPGLDNGLFSHASPACRLLFDNKNDTTLAGVDISAAKLKALLRRSVASGQSVAALLRAGLDQAADAPVDDVTDFLSPPDHLAAARVQSLALHRLIADRLAAPDANPSDDEITWGISELIQQTDGRLKRAIAAATAWPSKSQEVPA